MYIQQSSHPKDSIACVYMGLLILAAAHQAPGNLGSYVWQGGGMKGSDEY